MSCELATELPIGLVEHVTVHVKLMNGEILLVEMRPTDTDLFEVYHTLLRADPAYHPLRTYVRRLHDSPLSLLEEGECLLAWIGGWISHGWYRPLHLDHTPCDAVIIDHSIPIDADYSHAYECALMNPRHIEAFHEYMWKGFEKNALELHTPLRFGESVVGPHYPNSGSPTMIYMVLRYNGENTFQRCIVFVHIDDIAICPIYSAEDRPMYDPYSWVPQSPMNCHRHVIGSL